MAESDNVKLRISDIKGPEYFKETLYRNMIALLIQRGSSPKSIVSRVMHAKCKFEEAKRVCGIKNITEVTPDVIRQMYNREAGGDRDRIQVKNSFSDLGTLVLANTGVNPYVGALVIDRREKEESKIQRVTEGHRYQDKLREYAEDMRVRGLKELTIYDNIANLVRITNRLDDLIGPDYEIENLDTADFIMIRNSSTSSERTCKREIEILRRFIRYLTGHDPQRFRIMWNNTDDFAPNRKFITEEQWEKLIEGTGPRERLILILGAAMGLRRAEIAKIKLTDINGNILTVHGKGHGDQGKVVQMEMTKPVVDAILEWMPLRMDFLRRFGDNSDGYLLINQWRGKGTPMTPGGVGDVVRKLGRERGIDLTAHSLRRLFANMVNESGVDSDTLRRLMRHVSVQTTFSCYLNVNPKKMEMASEYVADKLLKITMKELPQPSF